MKFLDQFYLVLREKSHERGWQSSFADVAGISQDALSKIISGKTKSPGIETVSAIVDALGPEIFLPRIRRVEANAPTEIVRGDDLKTIQVYNSAGAGPGVTTADLVPLFSVTAPPAYFNQCDFAVVVDGHSMEPTIPNQAVVGVREFVKFIANELYIASIPYEGLVVKRVAVDREQAQFIFKSDNPDKASYPDYSLAIDEAEKIIMGRVAWVMYGY